MGRIFNIAGLMAFWSFCSRTFLSLFWHHAGRPKLQTKEERLARFRFRVFILGLSLGLFLLTHALKTWWAPLIGFLPGILNWYTIIGFSKDITEYEDIYIREQVEDHDRLDAQYEFSYREIRRVPNWVSHKVIVQGDAEAKNEFLRFLQANDNHLDFNALIPMPPILEGTTSPSTGTTQNIEAERETGYSNWYDWCIANWGTKWPAAEFVLREPHNILEDWLTSIDPCVSEQENIEFTFDTAWDTPTPIFNALGLKFPDLWFTVYALEEDWSFGVHLCYRLDNYSKLQHERGDVSIVLQNIYRMVHGHDYERYEEEDEEDIDDPE